MLQPRRVILALAVLIAINALLPPRFAFALGNTLQPLTQMFLAPGRPIYHALGGTNERIDETDDELAGLPNATLRDELAAARVDAERLRQQNARLTERLAELLPIKDLLAERGFDAYGQISARVVPGSTDGVLTIDAGSADGVTLGQTVVVGVHAVGRIAEPIASGSASVALITRVGDRLRVTITPPAYAADDDDRAASAFAVPIEARVRLDNDSDHGSGVFVAEDIPADTPLRTGDVVRLADELSFAEAQGFQLGRIAVVEPLPSNPLALQRIVVEPSLDLARLGRVIVLLPPDTNRPNTNPAAPNAGASP
ncbi:MAG: rod shape-determining protein MreC [Planctomycetota bacterium]